MKHLHFLTYTMQLITCLAAGTNISSSSASDVTPLYNITGLWRVPDQDPSVLPGGQLDSTSADVINLVSEEEELRLRESLFARQKSTDDVREDTEGDTGVDNVHQEPSRATDKDGGVGSAALGIPAKVKEVSRATVKDVPHAAKERPAVVEGVGRAKGGTEAPMLGYIFDTHASVNKHHHHDHKWGPHFEGAQVSNSSNMTVQVANPATLNCRISLLQDKTVSWVRRGANSELQLLTVGLDTYTGDPRYQIHFQYPNNWRLQIQDTRKQDEGVYECQISTHPPKVIRINLHINAPEVVIVDEKNRALHDKYYEVDSTIQLTCIVRHVAMTSSVVAWSHGDVILNYDVTRGGISVRTDMTDTGAISILSVAKIDKQDGGNYTCSISPTEYATVAVHVLNGESIAELHDGSGYDVRISLEMALLCLLVALTLS